MLLLGLFFGFKKNIEEQVLMFLKKNNESKNNNNNNNNNKIRFKVGFKKKKRFKVCFLI